MIREKLEIQNLLFIWFIIVHLKYTILNCWLVILADGGTPIINKFQNLFMVSFIGEDKISTCPVVNVINNSSIYTFTNIGR